MLHWPDLYATGAVVKVVAGIIQMAQFSCISTNFRLIN